jgi:hypothetical protein
MKSRRGALVGSALRECYRDILAPKNIRRTTVQKIASGSISCVFLTRPQGRNFYSAQDMLIRDGQQVQPRSTITTKERQQFWSGFDLGQFAIPMLGNARLRLPRRVSVDPFHVSGLAAGVRAVLRCCSEIATEAFFPRDKKKAFGLPGLLFLRCR